MPLAPGTKLGQYEVVDSLGAGGMGEVSNIGPTDPRLNVVVGWGQELERLVPTDTSR